MSKRIFQAIVILFIYIFYCSSSLKSEENLNTTLKNLEAIKNKYFLVDDEKDVLITSYEIDKFIQQIYSCLIIPDHLVNNPKQNVEIYLEINQDRTIKKSLIVDQNKYTTDKDFKVAADIALNAINNPFCSPLDLPNDKYEQWKEIKINFDYSYSNQANLLATFDQIGSIPTSEIKDLQENLKILKYYNGQIDGLFGKQTSQGVIKWVRDNNFPQIYNPEYLNKISDAAKISFNKQEKEKEKQQKTLEEELKNKQEQIRIEEERIALEQKQEERILSMFNDENETNLKNYIKFIRDFIKNNPQILTENQNEFDYLALLGKLYEWEKYLENSDDLAVTEAIEEVHEILEANENLNKYTNEKLELLKNDKINLVKDSLLELSNKIEELKIILSEDLENFYNNEIIETIFNSEDILENYSNLKEIELSIDNINDLLFKINSLNKLILNVESKINELKLLLIDYISTEEGLLIIEAIKKLEITLNDINPDKLEIALNSIETKIDPISQNKVKKNISEPINENDFEIKLKQKPKPTENKKKKKVSEKKDKSKKKENENGMNDLWNTYENINYNFVCFGQSYWYAEQAVMSLISALKDTDQRTWDVYWQTLVTSGEGYKCNKINVAQTRESFKIQKKDMTYFGEARRWDFTFDIYLHITSGVAGKAYAVYLMW